MVKILFTIDVQLWKHLQKRFFIKTKNCTLIFLNSLNRNTVDVQTQETPKSGWLLNTPFLLAATLRKQHYFLVSILLQIIFHFVTFYSYIKNWPTTLLIWSWTWNWRWTIFSRCRSRVSVAEELVVDCAVVVCSCNTSRIPINWCEIVLHWEWAAANLGNCSTVPNTGKGSRRTSVLLWTRCCPLCSSELFY